MKKFIIFFNLIGILIGIHFYIPILKVIPIFLWLFVIDCPLGVFFATISLVKNKLGLISSTTLLKYGIWTLIVYALYFSFYVSNWLLFLGVILAHLGMIFEAFLLKIEKNIFELAFSILFLISNDLIDYFYIYSFVLPTPKYSLHLLSYNLISSFLLPLILYHNPNIWGRFRKLVWSEL